MYKVRMFISSIEFVFIFLCVSNLNICFELSPIYILKNNIISIVMFVFAVIGATMIYKLCNIDKESLGASKEVISCNKIDYEYTAFITGIIIPIVFNKIENFVDVILLSLILIFTGLVYVKSDLYYVNPTLSLFGFKLYKVKMKNNDETVDRIIITKCYINVGDELMYLDLEENVVSIGRVKGYESRRVKRLRKRNKK